MEKMNYNDPVFGKVELTHVQTFDIPDVGVSRIQKLYRFPSGDYIVFSEVTPHNLPNSPFKQEFFVSKDWVNAIFNDPKEQLRRTVEQFWLNELFEAVNLQMLKIKLTYHLKSKLDLNCSVNFNTTDNDSIVEGQVETSEGLILTFSVSNGTISVDY